MKALEVAFVLLIAGIIFVGITGMGQSSLENQPLYKTQFLTSPYYKCVMVSPTEYGISRGVVDLELFCVPTATGPTPRTQPPVEGGLTWTY